MKAEDIYTPDGTSTSYTKTLPDRNSNESLKTSSVDDFQLLVIVPVGQEKEKRAVPLL
jgi:hypothetical protein